MTNTLPDVLDYYDRPRGLFTPRDRRFLAGVLDNELDENEKRQKRFRLRRRLVHALQDLYYLGAMEPADLDKIIEQFDRNLNQPERGDPASSKATVRFAKGTGELLALAHELLQDEYYVMNLKQQIAIRRAIDYYEATGDFGVFDVSINITKTDKMPIETVISRFANSSLDDPDPIATNTHVATSAVAVLDIAGVDVDFLFADPPEHEDLIHRVPEIIADLSDETNRVPKQEVLEELATREDVYLELAREAYRGAKGLQLCWEPEEDVAAVATVDY